MRLLSLSAPKGLLPTLSLWHFAAIVHMVCNFLTVFLFSAAAPLDRIELLFYDCDEEIEAPPPEGDATCPPLLCGIPFAFGDGRLREPGSRTLAPVGHSRARAFFLFLPLLSLVG